MIESISGESILSNLAISKYIHIPGHKDQLFDLENDPGEWQNLIGNPRTSEIEQGLKALIFDTFDPEAIEKDVRQIIAKRQLLKQWGEATNVQWAYAPGLDAEKNAVERYFPAGNMASGPSGAAGLWENETEL